MHVCVYVCTCVLPALCINTMCMPGTYGDQKRASDSLGTGLTDGCKFPCSCREPNPGPLQEQP